MASAASPYIRHQLCPEACEVSLAMPSALRALFPDRLRRAHRSMERVAAGYYRAELHDEGEALRLHLPLIGDESRALAEALVNRLVRQCHAPILPDLAARRLRIAPQARKALESCGLGPSLDVPAARHGKRYTLRAFSLGDMEALALHLASERADACLADLR